MLNGEVRQLREERELLHSAQIGRLEELNYQLEERTVPVAGSRSPSPGMQVDGRVG